MSWTLTSTPSTPSLVKKYGSYFFYADFGNTFQVSTDLVNWTTIGIPTGLNWFQGFYKIVADSAGTILIIYSVPNISFTQYTLYSSQFNGTGWDTRHTIVTGRVSGGFMACSTAPGCFLVKSDTLDYNRVTIDNGANWFFDNNYLPNYFGIYDSILFDGTDFVVLVGGVVYQIPYDTAFFTAYGIYNFDDAAKVSLFTPTIDTTNSSDLLVMVNGQVILQGTKYFSNNYSTTWNGGGSNLAAYALMDGSEYCVFDLSNQLVNPNINVRLGYYSSMEMRQEMSYSAGRYISGISTLIGADFPSTTDLTAGYFLPAGSGGWDPTITARPTACDLNSIAINSTGTITVATGDYGGLITYNGTTWTPSYTAMQGFMKVYCINDVFFCVGHTGDGPGIIRSTDGYSWITVNTVSDPAAWYTTISYDSSIGYIAAGYGFSYSYWNHSADGITWETEVQVSNSYFESISQNGVITAVGADPNPIAYSLDGDGFNIVNASVTITSGSAPYQVKSVATNGTNLVAVGYITNVADIDPFFAYSTDDGQSWTQVVPTLPTLAETANYSMSHVIYANGQFIAVGSAQLNISFADRYFVVATSTNGTSWSLSVDTSINNRCYNPTIAWDGYDYLVTMDTPSSVDYSLNKNIISSPDASTWSFETTTAQNGLSAIKAGPGRVVAVGSSGTVILRSV